VLNIDRELPLGMLLLQFMHQMLEWWGQVEPAPHLRTLTFLSEASRGHIKPRKC
jgi:hypothetical protein